MRHLAPSAFLELKLGPPRCPLDCTGTSPVEEVLIPEVRQQRYPSLDLSSLVLILERYREQARVGKEKTGHVSKRTLEGVCKQLRGQVVAGTAFSGLRVLEEV